jgi:Flp pilus assembly protein TadG
MFGSLQRRIATKAKQFAVRPKASRFLRNDKGAAAIEFAIVAMPFLALLFAIIETALVFFAGQVLETAVADKGRQILTGQAQTGLVNLASIDDFKNAVCDEVKTLFGGGCASQIIVDVRTYPTFAAAGQDLGKPLIKDGDVDPSFTPQYVIGGPGDIVVARVIFKWPLVVPNLLQNLGNVTSGTERLLGATAAFKNEPFGVGVGG